MSGYPRPGQGYHSNNGYSSSSNSGHSQASGYYNSSSRGYSVPQIQTSSYDDEYTYPTSTYARSNQYFPTNNGHSFNVLSTSRGGGLEPISPASSTPHGIIRSSDRDEGNPRLRYPCDMCGKKFDRPSAVDVHRRSHTQEKTYPCPVEDCRKAFGVKSNMTRHLKNVHGISNDRSDDRGHSPNSIRSGTSRGSSRSASPYDNHPTSSSGRGYYY